MSDNNQHIKHLLRKVGDKWVCQWCGVEIQPDKTPNDVLFTYGRGQVCSLGISVGDRLQTKDKLQ